MQIFKSRVGAVVAGAAVLALATGGGAAFAEKGGNPNPPGHDRSPALQDSGLQGYEQVENASTWSGRNDSTTAECSPGKKPLGGGYDIQADNELDTVMVLRSGPTETGWKVSGKPNEANADERQVKVWAICADAS